jgi:hypothetical protein
MEPRLKKLFDRLGNRLEFYRRRFRNEPLQFHWVESEGESVGRPIEISHLTLHDMMEHQANGRMTELVLLEGVRVNAIQVVSFERLNEWNGKTIIQPRWVEPLGAIV